MTGLLKKLYYRFNAWRFGESYGCGRCHHSVLYHHKHGKCSMCFCPEYRIERAHERIVTGEIKWNYF